MLVYAIICKGALTMEKTEEKKFLSDIIINLIENHKKKIWLCTSVLYVIFVIIFAIITINRSGGIQSILHLLNDYPEQKYQQLEQELQNIVHESDGIYIEELSSNSIKYYISYNEQSNSAGKYTIKLTDEVTITGTIGKDFKKENLIIEREYETEREYRKQQYISITMVITLVPVIAICFIGLILILLLLLSYIIDNIIKWYRKK